MLTMTDDATQAIERLLEGTDIPDGAGLRIESSGTPVSGNGAQAEAGSLRVVIASHPPGGDEVVEHNGARVFIEPTVTSFLEDKQLDVAAADGGVAFTLVEQP